MIILSNCLAEIVDEGFIKVANSLAWQIKTQYPETTVISYERRASRADVHMQLGKLLLTPALISLLRKKQEPVLFIPVSSNGTGTVVKLWLLSLANGGRVRALFALTHPMNGIGRFFLRHSGAGILVLSAEAEEFYREIVGDRVTRIKTGVDLRKFCPVAPEKKRFLREKYGLPQDKCLVLHVGHLKPGRNLSCLSRLEEDCHGVLVLSSTTQHQRDSQLRQLLQARDNVTILDTYLPDIQELYQLADVYLFPVQTEGACIDLPLSVLEAAACGTKVVCTDYGALKEFRGKPGFWFPDTFADSSLNEWIRTAAADKENPRSAVAEYDWNHGVKELSE